METGPLARMIVGYASGKEEIVNIVDDTLKKLGFTNLRFAICSW